jgi:hypothetical protein
MIFNSCLFVSLFVLLTGCVTPKPSSPPASETPTRQAKAPDQPQTDAGVESAETPTPGDPNCLPLSPQVEELPYFVKDVSIVTTGVMKPCQVAGGRPGYKKGSGWIAMGFPCTAGQGTLEWKGSHYAPKLIIFEIPNSCPMAPSDQKTVEKLVEPRLGMQPDARLLAYYPFAISYWEMGDQSDADTSYKIEVVTAGSRQQIWRDYRSGKPISVKLYGRQNSLMPSRHWYEVDAELLQDTEDTFRLRVTDVQVLTENDLEEIKQRCVRLSPSRNCTRVFP